MYVTTDLSTATHFWRVRGVNSAGTPVPVVGRAELHATGCSAARTALDDEHQSSDRRRGERIVWDVVLSKPAPEGGAAEAPLGFHLAEARRRASGPQERYGGPAV